MLGVLSPYFINLSEDEQMSVYIEVHSFFLYPHFLTPRFFLFCISVYQNKDGKWSLVEDLLFVKIVIKSLEGIKCFLSHVENPSSMS